MKNRIVEFIIKYQKGLALLSLAALILIGFFSKLPKVDGHLTGFNIENSRYYKDGIAIADKFGSTKFIQINIVPENTSAKLVYESLGKLEEQLKNEVPEARIQSLHHSKRLLELKAKKNESIQQVLKRSADLPLIEQLISKDQQSFLMVVFLNEKDTINVEKFNSLVRQKYEGINDVHIFSPFHVEQEIAQSIRKDIAVLTLAIFFFFTLVIVYAYRTISSWLFSVLIIIVTIIPVFFFFKWLDIPLNIITVLVIPVLSILSLSDALHLLTGYRSSEEHTHNEKMREVLRKYIVPSFLTSLTISIAFLSFQFNDSENIRNFGLITGITVMIGFLLTVGFSAFLLKFVKTKQIENHRISIVTRHILNRRVYYGAIMIFIFILSLFFLPSLKFNSNMEIFIPRGTQLKKDHEALIKQYYSQLRIEVMIEQKANDANRSAEKLVVQLHDSIASLPEVGKVNSIKDQIEFKSKYGVFGGFIRFPSKSNPYVSEDKKAYRLDIRLKSARDLKAVEQSIRKFYEGNEKEFQIKIFSNGLLVDEVNASVAQSLLDSMLFSEIFIALLILIMTKSVVYTLFFVFVNTIPLTGISLILYFFNLDLNILTAITTVVCVGVIVDDSIHIMYRRIVLESDLHEVSFGILTTTLILVIGFLMFLLSSFVPSQVFGVLSAIIFLLGVLSDMTLLPYLIDKYAGRKRKLSSPLNKANVAHEHQN